MGIGNDIRPRRTHGNLTHKLSTAPQAETSQPFSHSGPVIKADSEHLSKTLLEDEFFSKHKEQTHSPAIQPKTEKHAFKIILWFIIFVAIIGATLYQAFLGFEKKNEAKKQVATEQKKSDYYNGEVITQDYATTGQTSDTSTSSGTTATPAQTNESSIAIDKTKISIKVLNGNGVKNSGESVKQDLIRAGFSVAAVKNARTFNYATTIIYYQTGKSAEAELVQAALSGKTTSTEVSDTVAGEYNVVVVVGKK